jgi:hypothetical protein
MRIFPAARRWTPCSPPGLWRVGLGGCVDSREASAQPGQSPPPPPAPPASPAPPAAPHLHDVLVALEVLLTPLLVLRHLGLLPRLLFLRALLGAHQRLVRLKGGRGEARRWLSWGKGGRPQRPLRAARCTRRLAALPWSCACWVRCADRGLACAAPLHRPPTLARTRSPSRRPRQPHAPPPSPRAGPGFAPRASSPGG